MMPGVTVRTGLSEDLQDVMELAASCAEAPQWSVATWRKVLLAEGDGMERIVLLAESNGSLEELSGFGVVSATADGAEIESVAVKRSYRRQGIGRRLCEEAMSWARSRGAARIVLEVRGSNLAARRLYESLGFQQEGLRKNYYRSPEEDAVVMALTLVAQQPR